VHRDRRARRYLNDCAAGASWRIQRWRIREPRVIVLNIEIGFGHRDCRTWRGKPLHRKCSCAIGKSIVWCCGLAGGNREPSKRYLLPNRVAKGSSAAYGIMCCYDSTQWLGLSLSGWHIEINIKKQQGEYRKYQSALDILILRNISILILATLYTYISNSMRHINEILNHRKVIKPIMGQCLVIGWRYHHDF
jgi:hypothetical protein